MLNCCRFIQQLGGRIAAIAGSYDTLGEYMDWQRSMSGIPYRVRIDGAIEIALGQEFKGVEWQYTIVDSQGRPVRKAKAWGWETVQTSLVLCCCSRRLRL